MVIDLEEPRTPFPEGARERTRSAVRTFFQSFQSRHGDRDEPRWFARVQPPSTGQTLKDLRAVMGPHLTGILLPKIQGPEDVYRADGLLTCMEGDLALPLGSTILYPILETAQSIRLAYEIATASPRIHYVGGAVSRFGDIHQALGFRGLRKDANHFSFGPRYWWTPGPLASVTRSAGCGEAPSTTSPA